MNGWLKSFTGGTVSRRIQSTLSTEYAGFFDHIETAAQLLSYRARLGGRAPFWTRDWKLRSKSLIAPSLFGGETEVPK